MYCSKFYKVWVKLVGVVVHNEDKSKDSKIEEIKTNILQILILKGSSGV